MLKIALVIVLWAGGLVLAYGQTMDPIALLTKSSEACKQLEYVEYNTKSEQGTLVVEAHVIGEKSAVPDVGFGAARLIASGERSMGEELQPFRFSYDGEDFKLHEVGNGALKTLTEPKPATVGRLLGIYYYNTINSFLVNGRGLDHLLKKGVITEYVEQTEVDGRLAHHIRITRSLTPPGSDEGFKSVSSWFFDAENFLPVKRITGSIIITTEFLNLKKPKQKLVFDINALGEYNETNVTGNEYNIEGLPPKGSMLADFSLPDETNTSQSLDDVKGKVTLVDFWGTWCGPCLMAMPKLQALYDEYSEQGFQVVGISVADKPGKAEKFVEKKGYTYQFLFQGDGYAKKLGLDTFPTIFLINESGKILHTEKGNRPGIEKTLERIIKQELKIK